MYFLCFVVTEPPPQILCNEGDVRLVDGSETYGTVEVCYDGQWISVCNDGFDFAAIEVVCGQLGFAAGGKFLAFMHTMCCTRIGKFSCCQSL